MQQNTRKSHYPRLNKVGNVILIVLGIWVGVAFVAMPSSPSLVNWPARCILNIFEELVTKD